MRPESMKLFAQLLETYLPEDSSASGVIGSMTGGLEVVRKLHKEMGLAHDQQYQEIEKISWSVLKDSRNGAWVLIKGDKAAGAIKAVGGGYQSVAFDPVSGAVETYSNDRGGNNIDFLKSKIGRLRAFFVGSDTGERARKQRQRKQAQPTATSVTKDTLVKKFKPLWLRAMTAAEADIKGMIATMIKNSAYEKARRKMQQAEQLMSAIEKLETGSLEDTPNFVKEAVSIAIMMAASHYYPEKTGEIRKHYNSYSSQFVGGPEQLLKDISQGDTAKLGTILTFFKRSLVSG
jgi:hypothetical protein